MPTAEERHAMQMKLRGGINHRMPPFPCNVLAYSKNADINAFKLIRFNDQKSFDQFRAGTVAMLRVVLTQDDIADVPIEKVRYIFNQLSPESELGITEIPENELRGLAYGVFHDPGAATPYEDMKMTDSTTAPTATPEAKTAAEAKAQETRRKREEKEAAKKAAKEAAAAKRADGVIGNIKQALDTDEGTTADEILDKLVVKFPDRTREGMSSTVKIQFSRLAKSTGRAIINEKIKGRGRVYKFADKGAVKGEVETETPTPAATPEPTAPAAPAAPEAAAGAKKGGKK